MVQPLPIDGTETTKLQKIFYFLSFFFLKEKEKKKKERKKRKVYKRVSHIKRQKFLLT